MSLPSSSPPGSTEHVPPRSLTACCLAAAGYTACFAVASILSIRRGHEAEPLGIRTPFPIWVDVVVGCGTGLAAPWPLIVWLWRSSERARTNGAQARRATASLAVLGALFLTGAAAEPVSRRLLTGRLSRPERAVVLLNFLLPVMISGGALGSLIAPGVDRPSNGRFEVEDIDAEVAWLP